MSTQLRDTRPEAERVLIESLRQRTLAQRLDIACTLSETMIRFSRKAIRESHPGISVEELNLLFIEFNYGQDLAERYQRSIVEDRKRDVCQISLIP